MSLGLLAVLCSPAAARSAAPAIAHAASSATAVSAAAPECRGATASGAGSRREHTIVCLINALRSRHGLRRMHKSAALARAARRHARDMARRDYFDHHSPEGTTPLARAQRAGYRPRRLAENLAWGTGSWGTPAGTVAQWLDSPGHRRAMLDPRLRDLGIGAVAGSARPWHARRRDDRRHVRATLTPETASP